MVQLRSVVCLVLVCSALRTSGYRYRVCGRDLADALSAVCGNRGYNMAFEPEKKDERNVERRYKRGIVDECCRRGCSWGTLESYCSPARAGDNIDNMNYKLQKRSDIPGKKILDNDEVSQTVKLPNKEVSKHNIKKINYDVNDFNHGRSQAGNNDEATRHHKRRLFEHVTIESDIRYPNNLFPASDEVHNQGPPYKLTEGVKTRIFTGSKVKRNDVNKDAMESVTSGVGIYLKDGLDNLGSSESRSNAPPRADLSFLQKSNSHLSLIRHHRGRLQPKERQSQNGEMPNKNLKESQDMGDTGITSQIGTLSPYFLGHTLVLPSSRKAILPQL